MTKENETKENLSESQNNAEKPTRKGLHKYIYVYRFVPYLCVLIAIVFAIFGLIELFNLADLFLDLVTPEESMLFMMLFGIFGMVSRMYYKMFEERYD